MGFGWAGGGLGLAMRDRGWDGWQAGGDSYRSVEQADGMDRRDRRWLAAAMAGPWATPIA
jgi:hypothetical protein